MESTPDDREHGYDDVQEEEAYEAQDTDPDAEGASEPEDVRPPADE